MSRLAIWLLSLLAFLVLCVLCVSRHAHAIESGLEERTSAALSQTELRGAAQVTFSGRDATIRADDPEIADLVAERVRAIDGVRSATVAGPLAPIPETALDGPFELTPLASGGLALRGAVPDSATRDRLLAAAQMAFPDRRIRDGLTMDSSAPGDWSDDVAAAFSRLRSVQNPGVSVDSAGTLVLSGTVEGEGSRRNVGTRVAEVVAPRTVDNRLALEGAPATDTPPEAPTASGETDASSETPPRETASGAESQDTPTAAPEAAPSGQVEVQNALPRDADAQALARALSRSLGRGRVTFEAGTDRLTLGSADVLRRTADALKSQPRIAIELQAHTDSEGPTRPNQRLSEARARTAKRVLVDAGVPPAQILAAGYGESTPIATNATEDGRAQNRRVVFKLLRRR